MAARSPIKIDIGSTWARTLVYADAAGARIDLAGYTALMQIRSSFLGEVLVELGTENGRIRIEEDAVNGDTTGVIVLYLTDETTSALEAGSAVYDILITNAAGEAFRFVEGTVTLRASVTRPT